MDQNFSQHQPIQNQKRSYEPVNSGYNSGFLDTTDLTTFAKVQTEMDHWFQDSTLTLQNDEESTQRSDEIPIGDQGCGMSAPSHHIDSVHSQTVSAITSGDAQRFATVEKQRVGTMEVF